MRTLRRQVLPERVSRKLLPELQDVLAGAMEMKPTETCLWTMDDIRDVQEQLPENVGFGSLTGEGPHGFTLDLGLGIDVNDISERIESVLKTLDYAEVHVEGAYLTSGYIGSTSTHVLLAVKMA